MNRILIDLSTMVRWHGPPVGIARCQQKYAEYAFRHIKEVQFTVFDPHERIYRAINIADAAEVLENRLRVDSSMMPDLNRHRRHFADRVPARLRPAYWWITKTRRCLLMILEGLRLKDPASRYGKCIERIQGCIMKAKDRSLYHGQDGSRISCPRFEAFAGTGVTPSEGDTTIAMQTDWIHTDIQAIARLKQKSGFRHTVLCHDIIPIQFPEWYSKADAEGFKSYYDLAFATADRVIFTSNRTSRDASDYCRSTGILIKDSAVVPMGSNITPADAAGAALPTMLRAGKYALFVSTIEPRKNHRLLLDAWRHLGLRGIIQLTNFKLVFVGRRGWKMESFFQDLESDELFGDSVVHLENVGDGALARLYLDAGFCLYPPKFEGFGLPIVEALSYGKALLVSNAGPMPEIAGDFAVALSPDDHRAWADAMERWIENPSERDALAKRAAMEYRALSWERSAELFFQKALAPPAV